MKRFLPLALVLTLALTLFVGCSKPAVYNNGTFVGVSDSGDKGYTRAEVTIKQDKIESVTIVSFDGLGLAKTEAYPYAEYHTAIVDLAADMKSKNTWDVAAIAKATGTSTEAKQAAKRAMEKALAKPTSTAKHFDGKFMSISEQTEKGWTIAWVDIKDDKITDVKLHSTTSKTDADGNSKFVIKDDSYPYEAYFEALVVLPEQFIAKNGSDVEGVTGATGTCDQAKVAVEAALKLAERK